MLLLLMLLLLPLLQLVSVERMLTMSTGSSTQIAPIVSFWPRYDEPLVNQYPSTTTPVLLLEGTLDPQTEHMSVFVVLSRFSMHFQPR
jgi:hypothetical protein